MTLQEQREDDLALFTYSGRDDRIGTALFRMYLFGNPAAVGRLAGNPLIA